MACKWKEVVCHLSSFFVAFSRHQASSLWMCLCQWKAFAAVTLGLARPEAELSLDSLIALGKGGKDSLIVLLCPSEGP